MEETMWRLFVSLGVPGLALGVLYMLFRQFKWQFPRVPHGWVGPIITLFILVVGVLVYSALYFWALVRNSDSSPGIRQSLKVPDIRIAGNWHADVNWDGHKARWEFTFEVVRDELFGTAFTWDRGLRDLRDGRIVGDQISFRIVWKNRGGEDFWTSFRGHVAAGAIEFTMQREGDAPFKFSAIKDGP